MDFVFALHSHLPYVLNHGRWPHGSDWICEAAIDTYLPLLERLLELAEDRIPAPVSIGFTPVLANQLAGDDFRRELEAYFTQRLAACDEAPASLESSGDRDLLPLVGFWRERLLRLRRLFQAIDGDIPAAFRRLEEGGRLEIMGSAATHGFLPLLSRDESIRLQLALGRSEHRRIFGRAPAGCWVPECAYRPRGVWAPMDGAPYTGIRRGIEEHLADAGFRYFFADSHMAGAGRPLGAYGELMSPDEQQALAIQAAERTGYSPYHAYRVTPANTDRTVAVLVRDPRSSRQVWSRHHGYPGDEWYLEFHKIRWPGGLKLWRVSGPGVDLGAKQPYQPDAARDRARTHAAHFAELLAGTAAERGRERGGVIVAPFDTELFGHWWFEGVDFLAGVYRELVHRPGVRPVTAGRHIFEHAPRIGIRLAQGSWGANGDFSMWLNDATRWTWPRLWALEAAFWDAAPAALAAPALRPVLAQAARELLLAQSSDWQFIISTGAVTDYAVRRFNLHCDDAERLLAALRGEAEGGIEAAQRLADDLAARDRLFPDVLASVEAALSGSRTLGV
ncbi:MAG TPA: 1,4-alpha-glucan branching protein domain-containing protein [Gemmatimonadales bacterium]|nr:1,4-alpha-glucan branching protein domain-containing protein [Gemmatimonadales bacterium]